MEWYIPILIFGARICDVSIGTVRMIFVINGLKWQAAVLGFFEVCIWALAVGGLVSYLTNPFAIVAFAGGFATGSLIGMSIEQKIAIGERIIRVITPAAELKVATHLRTKGYRVTHLEGAGTKGPVEVTFLIIRRKELNTAIGDIRAVDPTAFISIERTERASERALPSASVGQRDWLRRMVRK